MASASSALQPASPSLEMPAAATVLAALGQAAFVWDIASDAIVWPDHAGTVFRDIPAAALASGAEFSKLIEPSRSIRSEALSNSQASDASGGESYRIEYGVRSNTSAAVLWIEECGAWFAGADGKPARGRGIGRAQNELHVPHEAPLNLPH